MSYVFDFKTARDYDKWLEDPNNKFVFELENKLIVKLLSPQPGERLLDIGCGTGTHLNFFADMGLYVTGLDPSPYMLDIARQKLGHRAELRRGVAEDLPFEDNAFDIATLITALEFTEDPIKAIEEACRVASDRIFLGVLNSCALKGIERRIRGIFTETIYNKACFFSVWGLKKQVRSVVGEAPISWRTVPLFPSKFWSYTKTIEQWIPVQRSPFGTFIGMVITLVPKYQAKNVEVILDYSKKRRDMATGVIRDRIEPSGEMKL